MTGASSRDRSQPERRCGTGAYSLGEDWSPGGGRLPVACRSIIRVAVGCAVDPVSDPAAVASRIPTDAEVSQTRIGRVLLVSWSWPSSCQWPVISTSSAPLPVQTKQIRHLVLDAGRVWAGAVADQIVQVVSRWHPQAVQFSGCAEKAETLLCRSWQF